MTTPPGGQEVSNKWNPSFLEEEILSFLQTYPDFSAISHVRPLPECELKECRTFSKVPIDKIIFLLFFMPLEHQRNVGAFSLVAVLWTARYSELAGFLWVAASLRWMARRLRNETQDMHRKRGLNLTEDVCKSVSLTGEADFRDFKLFAGIKPKKTRLAVKMLTMI